ncbi:MAG: NUDIX domain-containing protein [Candidatus Thermoplasmatota archaeon]
MGNGYSAVERSAGAVVLRLSGEGWRVLLLHYVEGHWDFVKGHIEPGEAERDTVLREAKEETGITDLRFIEGFREKVGYTFVRRGRVVKKSVVYLLAQTHQGDVLLSPEHTEYAWLQPEAALGRLTFPGPKRVLRRAMEYMKGMGQGLSAQGS